MHIKRFIKLFENSKINKLSIKNRLIFIFLIISIVPIFIMGLLSYNISKSAIADKITNYSIRELIQSTKILNLELAKYEDFSFQLIANQDINDLVRKNVSSKSIKENFSAYQDLMDYFQRSVQPQNRTIVLYPLVNDRIYINGLSQPVINAFKNSAGFQGTIEKNGLVQWEYFQNKIVLSRLVVGFPNIKEKLGVIAVFMEEEPLNNLINTTLYNDPNFSGKNIIDLPYLMAVNNGGKIMLSPFSDDIGKNITDLVKNPKILELIISENNQYKISERIRNKKVLITFNPMVNKSMYLLGIAPNSYLYAESAKVGWWAFLLGILISGAAIYISLIVAFGISKPLNMVMKAMKQAESNLSVRVNIKTNDELGELGSSFNLMLTRINELTQLAVAYKELKENQTKLLITEKMASLGRLTAGIAHEMNTPLATIQIAIKELGSLINEYNNSISNPQVLPEDHKAIAAEMQEILKFAEKASEKSSSFIRGIKGQTLDLKTTPTRKFQVAPVIKDSLILLEFVLNKSNCILEEDLDESVYILSNPHWFSQIITNLVINSIDACKQINGKIKVTLKPINKSSIILKVQDNGIGILDEIMTRIFDPLFTTKPFGEGTGLGLSIVLDLVNQLNGIIEVASKPGETVFSITIPCDNK